MTSTVASAIVHKQIELADLEREIRAIRDGITEYDANIKLQSRQIAFVQAKADEHIEWLETFKRLIGPFEQKYEDSKTFVASSFDYAKGKYKESLQTLIDEFGFHPTFKRWFDPF